MGGGPARGGRELLDRDDLPRRAAARAAGVGRVDRRCTALQQRLVDRAQPRARPARDGAPRERRRGRHRGRHRRAGARRRPAAPEDEGAVRPEVQLGHAP